MRRQVHSGAPCLARGRSAPRRQPWCCVGMQGEPRQRGGTPELCGRPQKRGGRSPSECVARAGVCRVHVKVRVFLYSLFLVA